MGAILDELRHAFAVEPETPVSGGELPPSLERIARAVVSRGMETPAIVFLEAATPLSFLGSQAMFAFWPFVKLASIDADYHEVARSLEDRRALRMLAARIEELTATPRTDR